MFVSEIKELKDLMRQVQWGRLLGVWVAFLFLLPPEAAAFGMLMSLASVCDIQSRIVPNSLCLAIAALGVVSMLLSAETLKWRLISLIGSCLLLLFIKVCFKGGIGMGDVKLMMASAFLLDVFHIMMGLFLGCAAAAVLGLIRFRTVRREIPLVPFLSFGLLAVEIL